MVNHPIDKFPKDKMILYERNLIHFFCERYEPLWNAYIAVAGRVTDCNSFTNLTPNTLCALIYYDYNLMCVMIKNFNNTIWLLNFSDRIYYDDERVIRGH